MLNKLLEFNFNFTIESTMQERFKFYFVDTPKVIHQYFEKDYTLHSKVMKETFSLEDIKNITDIFVPNEDLKTILHLLVFLENYTLLDEIYEKFHEKFKTVNQNSLLDEFKYVDMRQEVTRDKLEKIYCNLDMETDEEDIEAWYKGFEEQFKQIKDFVLKSNYFNL